MENIKELQDYYADPDWVKILGAYEAYSETEPAEVEDLLERLEKLDPGAWDRQEVVVCLKELDELGFGRFLKGAKGRKSRIEWFFPPKAIVKAARGDDQELRQLMADRVPQRQPSAETSCEGKRSWSMVELQDLLSRLSGTPIADLRVVLTIPEARKALADSQGISEDQVLIRLG